MGDVYRARDTKLGRDVALKVLPEAFATDPERLARFQREAELLASLNHTNIAALYGVDQSALVMELVEGDAPRGPMPVDDALAIAKQIVAALEYAHERGIIHRDLKPANIRVTPDGAVKLLDFGLAKALGPDSPGSVIENLTHSPTLTMNATRDGVILGTAAYMPPEQAKGRPADRRSDIWAFGAILYELLTGQQAFQGESITEVLASVMKEEPSFDAIPPHLRPVVERCLRKDPRRRWQAIGDVRVMLEEPAVVTPSTAERRAFPWQWIAAALAVTAGVGWWGWLRPRPEEAPAMARFATSLPRFAGATPQGLSITRDGSRIAYRAGTPPVVYLRAIDEFDPRPLPGTESENPSLPPCFSPDGKWIAYSAATGSQLRKVPVAGGAPLTLADGLDAADFCDWADDGRIYFGATPGIMRVPQSGGKAEMAAASDTKSGEISYEMPQLLPGGKLLLFTILTAKGLNDVQTAVVNLENGQKKVVLKGAGFARYTPTAKTRGHLIYGQNGSMFAVPFEPNRMEAGSPSPLMNGVSGFGPIISAAFSDSGTVAYFSGVDPVVGTASLTWVDRHGTVQPMPETLHNYADPVLSPDGTRVVAPIFDVQALAIDLWVYDTGGSRLTRLTFGGVNVSAVWTPDGRRVIYASYPDLTARAGELRSVPADNSAPPIKLAPFDDRAAATSISSDGKTLAVVRFKGGNSNTGDIVTVALSDTSQSPAGDKRPRDFLASPFNERHAAFSPDGRWMAYTSNESGRDEVYVVPFPGPGGKSQVSTAGGAMPRWNRNGRELFYLNGTKMMAVEVTTTPAFSASAPVPLFDIPPYSNPSAGTPYDVAPDGKRFVMLKDGGASNGQDELKLRVVLNWFEELRRLAPLK